MEINFSSNYGKNKCVVRASDNQGNYNNILIIDNDGVWKWVSMYSIPGIDSVDGTVKTIGVDVV